MNEPRHGAMAAPELIGSNANLTAQAQLRLFPPSPLLVAAVHKLLLEQVDTVLTLPMDMIDKFGCPCCCR